MLRTLTTLTVIIALALATNALHTARSSRIPTNTRTPKVFGTKTPTRTPAIAQ